jgi:tRNA pseudouridine55 synthase
MMTPQPNLSGWICLDKPVGLSSAQAVARVKYLLGKPKLGHAGTLDPPAAGVLPLALGEATKTQSYLEHQLKIYDFHVVWGEERTTDDDTGEVTSHSLLRPTREQVLALLPTFQGQILQTPPLYSAKKKDGKRFCDQARRGHTQELPQPCVITIDHLTLLDHTPTHSVLRMQCSKGTYVRSLCRDLGRALGCFGHARHIIRMAVGPFTKENSYTIEKLEEFSKMGILHSIVMPLATVLDDIPAVCVTVAQAQTLKKGLGVPCGEVDPFPHITDNNVVLYAALRDQTPIALVSYEAGWLQPKRVFNC